MTILLPMPAAPAVRARRARWARLARRLAAAIAVAAAADVASAADRCEGQPLCRDLGPFTATVVGVNVTRTDRVTAYQGVRTTVRFTNVGTRPIALAYRDHSSHVSDDQGLDYRWSAKAYGIGLVDRSAADPQFRLAPGESREASFDGVLQYSLRRQVAGKVFTHDVTLVELGVVDGQRVRELRDHVVSFGGLTATSGFGARPGAMAAASALAPAPATSPATPTPAAPGDCPAGSCQATGPLVARVVRVTVTRSGNVTAYQGVRTTVRFTNVGDRPLVLAYRKGSGSMSDETGQAYRWAFKSAGIGVVERGAADAQFRLAPGESREAAFEGVLQYSVRATAPGRVFTQDFTVAELEIVGPGQLRTAHEYALSFANLVAGGAGGGPAGVDPGRAINNVVDLFKSIRK